MFEWLASRFGFFTLEHNAKYQRIRGCSVTTAGLNPFESRKCCTADGSQTTVLSCEGPFVGLRREMAAQSDTVLLFFFVF
jgi:hypothetical protein